MSNMNSVAVAMKAVFSNFFDYDDDVLGKKIMDLEPTIGGTPRISINDCPGVIPEYQDDIARAMTHLDFLRMETGKFDPLKPAVLTAYVEIEYGNLISKVRQVLWDGKQINPEAEERFQKRGFTVSRNRDTDQLMVTVGNSAIVF